MAPPAQSSQATCHETHIAITGQFAIRGNVAWETFTTRCATRHKPYGSTYSRPPGEEAGHDLTRRPAWVTARPVDEVLWRTHRRGEQPPRHETVFFFFASPPAAG